ncbi:DUF262 domain-containing protein [Lentzea sp. CA-135723]|uniref:DUF262 domain-containing protein n=1 Tax=Lentzea sp. CA-135723 TaxID=3239950 RepID=UPI003D9094A9
MTGTIALNTSHQTISWFQDLYQSGRLVLRPSFQRRPVWTNEERSFLVDTILRGFPVPEIYVYEVPGDGDEGDKYAIVDGQQRLSACLEFMDDAYPVSFDVSKLGHLFDPSETPWLNKRYSEMEKEHRDRFRRYKLIVRQLEGVDDDELRHMFHRLNQSNLVLNAQELRYSMYEGGMLRVVEDLAEVEAWEHFRIFTKVQRRRMLDSEFIGELVIGYLHWPQNKKDNLDHYYQRYALDFPFDRDVRGAFDDVLGLLVEIFPEPRFLGSRWYKKSDFYTLFLALARGQVDMSKLEHHSLRELLIQFSDAIGGAATYPEGSPVEVYRSAVERAATDRARRVRREEALVAFLAGRETVEADEVEVEIDEEDEEFGEEQDEEYVDR